MAQVAVNVMRARVTVVGFNIAVITFQLNSLRQIRVGSVELPSLQVTTHLPADTALFTGLALAAMALVAYVASSAYDRVGVCDHWALLAGDLLMYLSLAQTLSAFFGPYAQALELMASDFPDQTVAADIVHWSVVTAGGLAWTLASYLGPIVSLVRSPFGRRANGALALAYVSMVLWLSYLGLQATRLQAALAESAQQTAPSTFMIELLQPLRW